MWGLMFPMLFLSKRVSATDSYAVFPLFSLDPTRSDQTVVENMGQNSDFTASFLSFAFDDNGGYNASLGAAFEAIYPGIGLYFNGADQPSLFIESDKLFREYYHGIRFMIHMKINSFLPTQQNFILRSDPETLFGDVYCDSADANKLKYHYYLTWRIGPQDPIYEENTTDTGYTCQINIWFKIYIMKLKDDLDPIGEKLTLNLWVLEENSSEKFEMTPVVIPRTDEQFLVYIISNGSADKIIQFGNNMPCVIHTVAIILNDINYDEEFLPSLNMTECNSANCTGFCIGMSQSGYTYAPGGTPLPTCVNPSISCGPGQYVDEGQTCSDCPWNCKECYAAEPSNIVCSVCTSDFRLRAELPCDCDKTKGYYNPGVENCSSCEETYGTGYYSTGLYPTSDPCMPCPWNCPSGCTVDESGIVVCTTCASMEGLLSTPPCECDILNRYATQGSQSCMSCESYHISNGTDCIACPWNCPSGCTVDESGTVVCTTCASMEGLLSTPPCECDIQNRYATFGGETCISCESYQFSTGTDCIDCPWNCAECLAGPLTRMLGSKTGPMSIFCTACKIDIEGLLSTLPCECDSENGYSEQSGEPPTCAKDSNVFTVIDLVQKGNKFVITFSSAQTITKCEDIFSTATVNSLGTSATCSCEVDSTILTVYASDDHNLVAGGKLVYSHADITIPESEITSELPSVAISIGESVGDPWVLASGTEYIISLTAGGVEGVDVSEIGYSFTYASDPITTGVSGNMLTISPYSLSPGNYVVTGVMEIESYNKYKAHESKAFTLKSQITDSKQEGPRITITLDSPFPSPLTCEDVFTADTYNLLSGGASPTSCLTSPHNSKQLFLYLGDVEVDIGGTFTLKPEFYENNTITIVDNLPEVDKVVYGESIYWHRDQEQNVDMTILHVGEELEALFTVTYEYAFIGEQNSKIYTFSTKTTSLTLESYSIGTADTYILSASVILNDSYGNCNFTYVHRVIYIAQAPWPGGRGMNASIPRAMKVQLSSEGTLDRDTLMASPEITCLWECFTDSEMTHPMDIWVNRTETEFSLPENYFPLGIFYMKLTVSKLTHFHSSTHGIMNMTDANIMLEISSPNLSNLRSNAPAVFSGLSLSLEGETNHPVSWVITPRISKEYEVGDTLTVPSGSFIEGKKYKIRAYIKEQSPMQSRELLTFQIPVIEIEVAVAKVINVGYLLITPTKGEGLVTPFVLEAVDWSDPEGGALRYRFGYQIVGSTSENYFRGWRYSNTVSECKLPPGNEFYNHLVEITVQAQTEKLSMASYAKNITITPKVIENKIEFVDDLIRGATSPKEKLEVVAATAYLIDEDMSTGGEDVCGGCDTLHGVCNTATQLCSCQPGYTRSPLCKITDQVITENTLLAEKLTKVLIENANSSMGTESEAAQIFNSASNILSGDFPLPSASAAIENFTYIFMDTITNKTVDPNNNLRLTPELSGSLIKTLGKIGVSINLERDTQTTTSGEAGTDILGRRNKDFIDGVQQLTKSMLSLLTAGSELPQFNVDSFALLGGKLTQDELADKTCTTDGGSSVLMPAFALNETNSTFIFYEYLVYTKNPHLDKVNSTKGDSQIFNLYSSNVTDPFEVKNLTDMIEFKYTLFGLTQSMVDKLLCSYYNKTDNNYYTIGIETVSKRILKDGKILIHCKSSHLSEFAMVTDPLIALGSDAEAIFTDNSLDTITEMDKISELNPLESITLWVLVGITLLMNLLIIIIACKDRRKKAKTESEEDSEIEIHASGNLAKYITRLSLNIPPTGEHSSSYNKTLIPESKGLISNDQHYFDNTQSMKITNNCNKKIKGNVDIVNHVQQNKVHVINGMRVMGENLNINSTQRIETKEVILDKKVQCLTAPKTLPPLKLVNPKIYNSQSMRQTDSEIESVKNNPNNIERMDIGIQSLSTKMDQKKNDIRRFGCCKTTLRTVSECHGLFSPFLETDGGIPRRDRILLLYLELIVFMWISGIFFDRDTGEEIENSLSLLGIVLLAIVIVIITIPVILFVQYLLKRPPIPVQFLNYYREIISEKGEEVEKWRRKQCIRTIIGYIVAWLFILFFSVHILVMSIIMEHSIITIWLINLGFIFSIDYILLQTSKGLILMCCLDETCVEFTLSVFAGSLF